MRTISDGIYNYFSQRYTGRLKILIAIFFFELFTILFFSRKGAISDQNLHYYTFSAIIQGFLALVAFLGAVVIYKLQIIETELNNIRNRMENDLAYFLGQAAQSFSWIEAMNEAGKILESKSDVPAHKGYIRRIELSWKQMSKISKERGVIRSKMVDFSFLSFFNIGFALFALPISKILLLNQSYVLAFCLLILGIIMSSFSMIFAFKIIRLVLGYSFKAHFTN